MFDTDHEKEIEERLKIGEYTKGLEENFTGVNLDMNTDEILAFANAEFEPTIDNSQQYKFKENEQNLQAFMEEIDNTKITSDPSLFNKLIEECTTDKYEANSKVNEKVITILPNKDKQHKFKIPEFEHPIHFVNYIETIHEKKLLEKNDNIFQLKNFKHRNTLNNPVIQVVNTSKLSERIFKDKKIITCLAVKGEYIVTGDNIGHIQVYLINNTHWCKSLIISEIENCKEKRVASLDIGYQEANSTYVVVASYLNGYIALFDCVNGNCKRLITDAHDIGVVCVKFLKIAPKEYEILSADLKGLVTKINISEGIFWTSHTNDTILKYNQPVFLVHSIQFTKEEMNKYYKNKEPPIILAIASLDFIIVNQIEPEVKRLYQVLRPKYFNKYSNKYLIPDFSFGFGYIPRNVAITGVDSSKLQRLFAISWGKVVYLIYCPFSKNGDAGLFHSIGHYVHDCQILRMSFVSNSVIMIFDIHKTFILLNTGLFTEGEVQFNSDSLPIAKQFNDDNKLLNPIIEIKKGIDEDYSFQTYIPDKEEKTNHSLNKASYYNTLVNNLKKIFVLGKTKFHYLKIQNWDELLANYRQSSEWLEALSLGLKIYQGTNTILPDVPLDEKDRKEKVRYTLRNMILEYVSSYTGSHLTNNNKNVEDSTRLKSDCINISIEFCIEMNDIDYLFNQIQPTLDNNRLSDLFYERLEPFILCDKIKNQNIGDLTISKIVDLYIKKGKFDMLSRLLTHLDIQSIKDESIINICTENNLVTPLIYIYMNAGDKEENCFKPIEIMYDMYVNAILISNLDSYNDCLNLVEVNVLEKSKQYVYHKLFWYINLILDQKKFPLNNPIDNKQYELLLPQILLWLLHDKHITNFIEFDSFTVLTVMARFFTEVKIFNIIKSIPFDKTKSEGIINYDFPIKDFQPLTLIEIIIERCQKVNTLPVLFDLYYFIAAVSFNLENINKSLLIESAKFLLKFHDNLDKALTQDKEVYSYHYNLWKANDFYKRISHVIINMIKANRNNFTKDELIVLLEISMKSSFYVYVSIYLYIETGNYVRCLSIYLNSDNIIDNRTTETFTFIVNAIKSLSSSDNNQLRYFKEEVLSHFLDLAKLSVSNLLELNNNYYNSDHRTALTQLSKDESKQLEYIEKVLKTYRLDEMPSNKDEIELYYFLLAQHIELLCSLNKMDEIVPHLENRPSYPIEKCLPTCLKYKAYDAAIFFYKTKCDFNAAFDISINIMNETISSIKEAIKYRKEDEYTKHLRIHICTNLTRTIDICLENSEKKLSDDVQMWLELMKYFYDVNTQLIQFESEIQPENKMLFDDFKRNIYENIETVLITMHPYVKILSIIEFRISLDKDAKYKEFKKVFEHILTSYSTNIDMLQITKKMLLRAVGKDIDEVIEESVKGHKYVFNKCDKCNNEFKGLIKDGDNEQQVICVFKCGHKLHKQCCVMKQGEDVDCLICNPSKSDTNYIVGTKNESNSNSSNSKHDKQLVKDNNKNNSNSIVNKKYQDDLTKLAHLDKYFLNANQIHF